MDNINLEITLDKAHSLYEKEKLLIFDIRTKKNGNDWSYSQFYFN